jgi:nucleoid-associated protein YgaU
MMRSDVKLGMVFSMVFVLVAGGYFFYRQGIEQPLLIAEGPGALGPKGAPNALPSQKQPTTKPRSVSAKKSTPSNKKSVPVRTATKNESPTFAERQRSALERLKSGSRQAAKSQRNVKADSPKTQPLVVKNGLPKSIPTATEKTASGGKTKAVASPQGAIVQLDESVKETPVRADRKPIKLQRGTPLAATQPKHTIRPEPEAAVETHRIQSGDTITALSERYYGSARYTRFLIESNPDLKDPDRLKVGALVRIPPRPEDTARTTTVSSRSTGSEFARGGVVKDTRTYRVKSGDSFYVIAKNVLGDANRWKELFELNKDSVGGDPTRLQVGQVLQLPPK